MEAAILDLPGDEAIAKTLETPVIVARREGVDVPEIGEFENQPKPQELIERPKKSLWKVIRVKILPVVVFLSTVAAIIYFWPPF